MRVSLASVGRWIRSLGRLSPQEAFGPLSTPFPPRSKDTLTSPSTEIAQLRVVWEERKGKYGDAGKGRKMLALRQAGVMSITPVREGILNGETYGREEDDWGAPMKLDADEAIWV